jgi:hypothetical protein
LTSRSPAPPFSLDDKGEAKSPYTGSDIDPLAIVPSSPAQIYLNLLILEASLRSQYLLLRARRRQNTFFLLLLAGWNAYFFYALFLAPREDGSGIGGSVYWVIEMGEKMAFMGGIVTGLLIWFTGQWERGVRWPRRFIGVTNRGLRTMNCKIVVIKGPWWKETLSHFGYLFPFYTSHGSSYHYVDAQPGKRGVYDEELGLIREEDLAPGGDCIKLLLLPKPFSADFRENWELYRTEYWEKENDRRAALLKRLKDREHQIAKVEGGWKYRLFRIPPKKSRIIYRPQEQEKMPMRGLDGRKQSLRRAESHSRNTSRSSTPDIGDGRPPSRGTTGHRRVDSIDSKRRPKLKPDGIQSVSKLSRDRSSLSTFSTLNA